jgi:hypothetical protein
MIASETFGRTFIPGLRSCIWISLYLFAVWLSAPAAFYPKRRTVLSLKKGEMKKENAVFRDPAMRGNEKAIFHLSLLLFVS